MRFIGQIAVDATQFVPVSARMAYLFMTDEDEYVDGTWEPNGGENAVILQPGPVTIKTTPVEKGPSLYRMVQKKPQENLVPEPCEFSVTLKPGEDPDFIEQAERSTWNEQQREIYASALEGNKIGGSPLFIQNTEFPGPGRWRLLVQLDSANVPFHVNFGDTGVGYLFLSEDGQAARFLWQCC